MNWKTITIAITFEILLIVMMVNFMYSGNVTFNVSALQATGNLGIYWDSKATKKAYSIDWGVLSPGQTTKSVVYVRNEANDSTVLVLSTANWNPTNASKYLRFSWNARNTTLDPGDIIMVNQYLSVSLNAKGNSTFSFDIVFEGRGTYLGDINRDGRVDVRDTVLMGLAYDSTPASPNWNPDADINGDRVVNILDLACVAKDFGKS